MSDISQVTALVLAGGLGTRLRSRVPDHPKVLAQVRGRPFLAFLLDQLADAGIREVILCTGFRGEQIQDSVGSSFRGMSVSYSQESESLGTAGALRLALPRIKSPDVLAMNGDSYSEVVLNEFWKWHSRKEAAGSILVTRTEDTRHSGRVDFREDGRVLNFDEKAHHDQPGWINAGIYFLQRSLLLSVPTTRAVSIEREMFPSWVTRGLYAFPLGGRFLDVGTPETYAAAENFFEELTVSSDGGCVCPHSREIGSLSEAKDRSDRDGSQGTGTRGIAKLRDR